MAYPLNACPGNGPVAANFVEQRVMAIEVADQVGPDFADGSRYRSSIMRGDQRKVESALPLHSCLCATMRCLENQESGARSRRGLKGFR